MSKLKELQGKLANLEKGYEARKKKLAVLKSKQNLTQKDKATLKLLEKQVKDYPAIIATTKKAISALKSGASQTNIKTTKTTNVRGYTNNNIAKPSKKFKATDKILVISVDDLDNVKHMHELIKYLTISNIPVTLFPHIGADQGILKEMRALPNAKQGWHGEPPRRLDANPLSGTDKTVIAWSYGEDSEGRKKNLGNDTIARGTIGRSTAIGKFDQHNLPSLSLGDIPNTNLIAERNKVLKNGGVLSVHLHHAGKGGVGLKELKETVAAFKAKGGKIVHMEQLKGYGK